MAQKEHLSQLRKGVVRWNAWRNEHAEILPDLSKVKLSRADLNGANLRMASLRNADFSLADLGWADLSGADLSGTNLSKTNLSMANLSSANLKGADLSEANLSNANLSEANLSEAALHFTTMIAPNLRGADFSNAITYATVFGDVDLSVAKGLDAIDHHGPSTIGIDTIYRSNGAVPDAFLRGAGVPDNFIGSAGSLAGKQSGFYSCFISYSHADKAFALRLHATLQGRGIRCWCDEHQVLPGDDIYDQVDRGIRLWDKVLLCCSKDSLSSWWVDNEIGKTFAKEQALTKERGKKALALIPLNLDGKLFDWKDGKADEIRRRLAADFTGWESDNKKFAEQFERVARALRVDGEGHEPPPKALI